MNAQQLNELFTSGQAPLVLNVLPEAVHAARRIPGSANACVYEWVFLEKVAEWVPVKNAPVVVYGAGEGSLDSKVAVLIRHLRDVDFFEVDRYLGQHIVNDHVHLHVKVHADRVAAE